MHRTIHRAFTWLTKKDMASWNLIIAGYGIHGHGKKGLELFGEMVGLGLVKEGKYFFSIRCNHAKLVWNRAKIRALNLIDDMPEEPDTRIWFSLPSSCRNYDFDMGKQWLESYS